MISFRVFSSLAGGTARFDAGVLRPWAFALVLAWSSLFAGALAWPGSASAQEGADESRAAAFQAVEGPQKENVPGGPLLVTAYGFVLASLVAYVVRLALMQRKTAAEVDRLVGVIEQKRKG